MVQFYYEHQFLFRVLIQYCSSLLLGCEELFDPTDLPLGCLNFYSFEFLFVINHIRRPNESNLLNYFTLSFLHKRLRGRK